MNFNINLCAAQMIWRKCTGSKILNIVGVVASMHQNQTGRIIDGAHTW